MLRVSSGFEEALKGSRYVNVRASVLDKRGNPLPTDLDIHSWSLDEDVDSVPMGVFTLTVVDPAYRIDVEPTASQAKWASRLLSFEWGVYVDDRFEYVSLFEGPITAARRQGAEVTFSACTKDGQGVDPYFFRRPFSVRKHARISQALRAIAEERGERKLDIPSLSRRLDRDRTWVSGQEPWRIMQQLTNDLDDHQLYYRGNGDLRLRRYPDQPAWRFTHDGAQTIVLGHPENRFDIEPLINSYVVRGERHYKKPVDIKMELDEKAEIGDNSIHVSKATKDEIADGQKIVIGSGEKEETRTIAGSYTSGAKTIPLTRALDKNHKVGAPATVTVQKDKVRPVVGRAVLKNHPFSAESLTDGHRPRIKIEDRPGIHRKDTADHRAERKMRQMRVGIEHEIGVNSLLVPHLEIGDVVVVDTTDGTYWVRLRNRQLSSDGSMVINRRRKLVPKKPRKKQRGPKARVKRVRKEINGGVLDQAVTTSWSDGSNLSAEAITDFSAEGGTFVFEPGTARAELAHYTSIDEDLDELVGVIRPNTKRTHARGTFIQAGDTPTVAKMVDGYVDDETVVSVGIPVPPTKYGYLSVDTLESDDVVIQLDVDDQGELSVLEGPAGEPPKFDADGEILPPASSLPAPTPETARVVSPPTSLDAVARTEVLVQPTWFLDMSWDHSGLYEDGRTVAGLSFRIELWDGEALAFSTDTTATSYSRLVEGEKDYEVRVYARDLAGNTSEPAIDTVSTTPDEEAPDTPTGVTLTGGANGGGKGLLFLDWDPITAQDFMHVEIHASTEEGFDPVEATKFLELGGSSAAVIKAFNGSVMTTFDYETDVFIRLIAVDTSGNKSDPSAQVSGSAERVQSADVTDLQSDNFETGVAGWAIYKSGNAEFQNGTFRGTVVAGSVLSGTFVAMESDGDGSVILDGALNRITLGDGLILSGSGSGSVTFGSGCTIYGSDAGSVAIGTGLILDGTGSGSLTGGTLQTATSGRRVVISSAEVDAVRFMEDATAKAYLALFAADTLTIAHADTGIAPNLELKSDRTRVNQPIDFSATSTPTAGALLGYFQQRVNGTLVKIPYHALS